MRTTQTIAGDPATGTPRAGRPPGDGRAARWQEHRAARRQELIKAARRGVHRLGPAAPMEDIAAEAGTSKSVFYRYFGDKAGLQRAMGEVVIGQMKERLIAAATTATTPRDGLHSMVSEYLDMAESSPNVYAFVTRVDGAENGTLSEFFAAITAMMEGPMHAYTGPGVDGTLAYWPAAAIGFVRTAGEQWIAQPDTADKPDRAAMAARLTGWLAEGVTPAGPAPPATQQAHPRMQ